MYCNISMKEKLGNSPKKLPYYHRKVNSHKQIFDILSINFDREKIKNFIIRKNEYLDKNRVMDDDKFIELFWWTWKYNKSEIKQDNHLWLCYAYSGFEILKKSNFFKELIQTNFREIWEWNREVRIPFCDPNWYRIKVNKNEIFDENWNDREYSFIPRDSKSKEEKTVKITSWSSLWIKILEIAFMKSYIVFNAKYPCEMRDISSINARWQFNLAWDFEIKDWHLRALEGWNVWQFMQHIFWKNIVKYNNPDTDTDIDYKNLMKEFNTWFIKISLISRNKSDSLFDDSDIKIINTKNKAITKKHINTVLNIMKVFWDKVKNLWKNHDKEITKTNKNDTKIKIISDHVYSVERFYETHQWEPRVLIVNPWNTAEKIDMPVQKCIDIFQRQIIWFRIDKMFINKNEES